MPLKLTLSDLNEAPESVRTLYRPRGDGGGYILDVEGGVVAKSVHDEFRQNNIALRKQMEGQESEISRLRSQLDDSPTRSAQIADLEARLGGVTKEKDSLKEQLAAVVVDQQLAKVATGLGAHPQALDDITTRLRPRFRVGEGNVPFAVDTAGNTVYGDDGRPLGIEGAVRQLVRSAPHLFKSSSGVGAGNNAAGGGHQYAGNPWSRGSWNVTEQMKLTKSDPGAAARMQAEAKSQG